MIKHSQAYAKAVVGDSRRQYVKAVFDLMDPDAKLGISSPDESPKSLTEQALDRGSEESEAKYATLEVDRWALDGTWEIMPDNASDQVGQIGWMSNTICKEDGSFVWPFPSLVLSVSNVEILQAMTLQFSGKEYNGFPTDFLVEFYSGNTLLHSQEIKGNTEQQIIVAEFTVYYPTKIVLIVHKWNVGFRRARVLRMMIGLYETWDTRDIQNVDIYTEVTFSGLSIPYSSCTIRVYNKDHRFDPYAPGSIFKSIEDRQAVVVSLGMRIEDGSIDWLPGGTYYQQSGGWKLQDLTVEWDLLDIIGMLVKRKFVVPPTLPTTLAGWVEALMGSLGDNFREKYIVDDDVKAFPLTAKAEEVDGKNCGEILRFLCMASNTWPRQDFETGFLRVGKLSRDEGNRITIDNMVEFPQMSANSDIADISFKLDEGEVTFAGNNTNSEVSLSVSNPFIHTEEDARRAVISCLFNYGGKSFEIDHRGNPSSSCGDIQSIDTQFGSTITARLYKQQIKLDKGVMTKVPSYLVQSPNDTVYANKTILTGAGTWVSPISGTIKLTIIGGGQGGQGGGGGVIKASGPGGFGAFDPDDTEGCAGGSGGKIFILEFVAVDGQSFDYSSGAGGSGGAGGQPGRDGIFGLNGTETTFGVFTSGNGTSYANGLMDIQNGAVYAQTGGANGNPVSGSYGSGGTGGTQGANGVEVYYKAKKEDIGYRSYIAKRPEPGKAGGRGQNGCVILEW